VGLGQVEGEEQEKEPVLVPAERGRKKVEEQTMQQKQQRVRKEIGKKRRVQWEQREQRERREQQEQQEQQEQ